MERALRFLTSGYGMDVNKIVNGALFAVKYDEMVIMKDIEFFSMCEHHMLPFFGKVHVAYIPQNKVIGLSKLPRIVDVFARRLQIQERLTQQIAQTIQEMIDPRGRWRNLRGAPLLHHDARGREAAFRSGDQRHARRVPRSQRDARRVPVVGQLQTHRLLSRIVNGRLSPAAAHHSIAVTRLHPVRRHPDGMQSWRTLPTSLDPGPVSSTPIPVSVCPRESRPRRIADDAITRRRGRHADIITSGAGAQRSSPSMPLG